MAEYEERPDRFTAMEDRFAGYEVYDLNYEKICKVDDLFVDEADNPEYICVKMSSAPIPFEAVRRTDDSPATIVRS